MTSARLRFDERLSVPLRWWVQATMLVASFWLAMIVALPAVAAWAITAGVGALAAALLLWWGSARVQVDGDWFRAGRARIQPRYLGEARVLDAEATRRTAGVDADARAYLLIRPYLKRSVRVELRDPRDATPYWLVSSRRPEQLVTALTGVVGHPEDGDRLGTPHSQED